MAGIVKYFKNNPIHGILKKTYKGEINLANIYDTINQLERDIRELDAYDALSEAMDKLLNDDEARELYINFRNYQTSVQTKMQLGQELSEEDVKKAEDMQKTLANNAVLSELMQKEQQLNQYVEDVNQAVGRPIREIYDRANQATKLSSEDKDGE